MQTSEINISKVIEEGKLKTYFFGASFIEVYWLYHKLSPGHWNSTAGRSKNGISERCLRNVCQ